MQDKNGTEIKAGDTLFNPHDRDQYHAVLMGDDRKLYLGDFDSPLERYAPQLWWEVVPNASFSREPERSGGESAGSDSYGGNDD